MMRWLLPLLAAGCAVDRDPIVVELSGATDEQVHRFAVDGARDVRLVTTQPLVTEAFVAGGELDGGGHWLVPSMREGVTELVVVGDGEVTLSAWTRGARPPEPTRARSATWFDARLLDDPSFVSVETLLSQISGGEPVALLERWFAAFARGPGAGRATFAQWLTTWDRTTWPFKVTGVHNRQDLANARDCGELRVSVASTDALLSPLHILFVFRQAPRSDDVLPDGTVHCRGTARSWARLAGLDDAAFASAARELVATTFTREHFVMAETVELTLSPWQWRQWIPDGAGGLHNPPLFQTIDVARVNAAGPTRDAFLADVAANRDAILARTWPVPAAFRSSVIDAQPNIKAPLVSLDDGDPAVAYALGMIGCPRCHTDDADFVHTNIDRVPSAFYDRELDARVTRIHALAQGEPVAPAPFGPLQPLAQ